ncbi:hypothetical protein FA95DRAFT_1531808 [Auriscalpium vulgare]|uniref:Uncharacterized protein n=1 Tax=Auriscalpium vulgare TaxID=40419 RepID=A0ACB8SA07_9AGAM|nr:hypothetical protein FA95DRAFT_1531808 [Auriscalpium vulgare]
MSSTTIGKPSKSPDAPYSIHVEIPERFYTVPMGAVLVGTVIGMVRGARAVKLRFLAENAHRPPTTVRGWYFYNKTKNYKMMLGGLARGGSDAAKLGFTALGWVTFEEMLTRLGWDDVREMGAGLGTSVLFAGVYRLPVKTAWRAGVLGAVVGTTMGGMRWAQRTLRGAQAGAGGAGGGGSL